MPPRRGQERWPSDGRPNGGVNKADEPLAGDNVNEADEPLAEDNARMVFQATRWQTLVLVRVGTSVLIGGSANNMQTNSMRARVKTSTSIIMQVA